MQQTGNIRPGGRTERTFLAVMAAARRELVAYGYAEFRIERVAVARTASH